MLKRGVTAVRVPLNEQCWTDDRPAIAFETGAAHRAAVGTWDEQPTEVGLAVILDLQWSPRW